MIQIQQQFECMRCAKKFKSFAWEKDVMILINFMVIPLCKKCKKKVVEFIYEKTN